MSPVWKSDGQFVSTNSFMKLICRSHDARQRAVSIFEEKDHNNNIHNIIIIINIVALNLNRSRHENHNRKVTNTMIVRRPFF